MVTQRASVRVASRGSLYSSGCGTITLIASKGDRTATATTDGVRMTGPELERLHDWVLKKHNRSSFTQFVRFKLDEDLDHIAEPENFRTMVFEVLRWADMNGRLDELVEKIGYTSQAESHEDSPRQRPADPRTWAPVAESALQPAPHFAGREVLLNDLRAWAVAPSDQVRVTALVAAGGTGKTALAERVLASLPDLGNFGVFVWTFDENTQTEGFLRQACRYFIGEEPDDTGGLLGRLQQTLTGTTPHLLILDGLERVQVEGSVARPRGEIDDPLLRRLLRWLAAGKGTRAKVLIASRFPFPDLADWRTTGYRELMLEDLDTQAARALLRRWGVKGGDDVLDRLGEQVHRHALTVDVLGSYLATYWGGDPAYAPSFRPEDLLDTDPKAARLHRVLTSYAERLVPKERDLLARLSAFPRGVGADVLHILIAAGGDVAGSLAGIDLGELMRVLERLRGLGLIFRYGPPPDSTFTAHPFVRGFFVRLLALDDPRRMFEAVRSELSAALSVGRWKGRLGLIDAPDVHLTEPATLDRYERLIEVSLLAGRVADAYDLYWSGLQNYRHLGWRVGDYARSRRIAMAFAPDGQFGRFLAELTPAQQRNLAEAWGMSAFYLGDPGQARRCLGYAVGEGTSAELTWRLLRLAEVEFMAGRPAAARECVGRVVALGGGAVSDPEEWLSSQDAAIGWFVGETGPARTLFTEIERRSPDLSSLPAVYATEFWLATGDIGRARERITRARERSRGQRWWDDVAECDALLALLEAGKADDDGTESLRGASDFASRSGHVRILLRCHVAAAVIARHRGRLGQAASEAESGIQLADSCGFARWSIDIRLELAQVHLAACNLREAVTAAEEALIRSEHTDCRYAWGIADALHLLGVAQARLGAREKAFDHLRRAVGKRRRLEHPGLCETEDELRHVTRNV